MVPTVHRVRVPRDRVVVARVLALSTVVLSLAAAAIVAQPRFRSGVELLRLSVTVVDDRGEPIRDLTPRDFSVTVDGKPRLVEFAQFYRSTREATPAAATAAAQAPLPSYAINTAGGGGRVVVFAVDLMAIKAGYERPMLDTAAKLVDALGADDAVGLMPIPGKGVDLTRDRSRVSEALKGLRGTTNVPFTRHYFTIREAVAFEQRDRRTISEVIDRECCEKCVECPQELREETREFLTFARQHVASVLTSLTALAGGLETITAPKTIVLLSAGLPFEQESLTRFTELQRAVARAGILLYAVQVDQPDADASVRRKNFGTYEANDIQTGLANIATMSGGAMFAGVGTAAGVFDRLRSEISAAYELGVEGAATDADGKAHDVKVVVARPGATVRSRRQMILPETPVSAGKRLGNLLSQPVDVADLPVAVSAYSVRGDEATTLKVIINAELGGEQRPTDQVRYALFITKGNDVVFQTNDAATSEAGRAHVLTAAQLAPGRYRLRFAAIDIDGRGGTVELPISVGLRATGAIQTSDVIVGTAADGFRPAVQLSATARAAALIELYSSDPARFTTVRVLFEVRRVGETQIVTQSAGALRPSDSERRQIAEAPLDFSSLRAGDYLVSAVIVENGRPSGRISRQITLRQ